MTIPNYIALGAILVSIITLIWQVRDNTKQIRLQNFTIYTERYQKIFLELPLEIESDDFEVMLLAEDTLKWLRAYFDLCSEEYYLHRNGLVAKNVWILWESGMADSFKKPAYKEAWKRLQKNQYYSREFENFVKSFDSKAS